MPEQIKINDQTRIPSNELTFRFARSGGKGGQNVNKVETKVELLFDIAHSPSLTSHQREQLKRHLGARMDGKGVLHIVSQDTRSQKQNRRQATERLVELLMSALRPRRKRISTVSSGASKEHRISAKKHRGKLKKLRSGKEHLGDY